MKTTAYLVLLLLASPLALSAQDPLLRADQAWVQGDVDTAYRIYNEILRTEPTNVTALHRVALVEAFNQRYDRSLTLLDRALRTEPSYTPAAIDRARVLAWSERYDEASGAVGSILQRDRGNLEALELQAQIAGWAGRHEEALGLYDRLSGMTSDPSAYAFARAQSLAATGNPEEALRLIDPLLAVHPDSVQLLEAKGQLSFQAGRFEDAEAAYGRLIRATSDPTPYYIPYARALAVLDRDEEAWTALERGLAGSPDDISALELRARLAEETGRPEEALSAYTRLIAATPDPTPYRIARARVLASVGSGEAAIALDSLDALSASGANEVARLQLRADIAMAQGRFDLALESYDRLLAISPNDPVALEAKARVASWEGRYDESVAAYDRLLQVTDDPGPHRLARARVLAWDERYDESLRALEGILAEEPTNVEALQARAEFAAAAGRFDESVAAYDLLAATNREQAIQHALPRAQALAYDQQYQQAIAAFEAVLAREPNNRDALVGLAQVLSFTAQHDSASAVYARALANDPTDEVARAGEAQVSNWSGDLTRGERLWRGLVEESPDNPDYAVGLASNLRMQGRYGAAEDILGDVTARFPENTLAREELSLIETATAPQVTPTFSYVSDSDENRITTLGMSATVQLGGPFEMRVAGNRKDLEQKNRPELAQQTLDGQVVLGARVGPGWTLSGGVGVWQPEEGDADGTLTVSAGVASPAWMPFRGALTYQRATYDVSALVIDQQVEVDEVQLNVGARLNDRATWSANVGGASFHGTEDNMRWLGGTQVGYQIAPWLRGGPALRAFTFEKDLDDGYWDPESYFVAELPLSLGPSTGNFRPTLEVSPGIQRIEQLDSDDPWGTSVRVQAGIVYGLGARRQLGITGVFANSGINQLSDVTDAGYEYRAVSVVFAWAF